MQFTVNETNIQYPENLTRTATGRWETIYPANGGRPRRVFKGADVGEITFDMHLNQFQNDDNIRDILSEIVNWVNIGYAQELVIGTKAYGFNKWICKKAVEKFKEVDGKGIIINATVTVTLEEYQ